MPDTHSSLMARIHADVLPRVQKPSRYLGTEVNAVHKDASVASRVCLAFPDMYDLGLGNLGILVLYNILNQRPDVWCERAYAPAPDLEAILRAERLPLFSLESKTALRDFHLLGFTLQYELTYTNILNMLDLGGVPVSAKDRTDTDPIVVAGGPCVFNPEPLADFIDAFALGDGEDVILDLVDTERATRGLPRAERLEALAAIPGVYVPALFPMRVIEGGWIVPNLERAKPVRRRVLANLDAAPFPTDYIVPYTEQAHDRVSLEVLRGCTQSCRFCQAGMTGRPVRERSLPTLNRLLNESIDRTGYEDVALSSLSTCDYSQVRTLVAQSVTSAMQRGASVGLPSLRSDSFSVDLSDMVRTIRQTGLTFAPEAATNRMRAVINKWIADDDLVAMTSDVFSRGWNTVKLYFMIGLPTETDDDVLAIGRLANRVHGAGRAANRRAKVNLGVSTFVPKPHTPFQWDRQINVEETHYKHFLLRRVLGPHGPKFGHHEALASYLEGVLSRADRRAGRLLLLAWQYGARFDGWNELLNWPVWERALADWGLDPDANLREIPRERPLPWDHINVLVSRDYLLREREKSRAGALTSDCRYSKCNECGVIRDETRLCAAMLKATRDGLRIERNWKRPAHLGGSAATLQGPETGIEGSRNAAERRGQGGAPVTPMEVEEAGADWRTPEPPAAVCRIVFRYAKTGLLRYLSHLELSSVVQRALRRANLPLAMTQGFHPLPKLAFATPLPTGLESTDEWADVTLTAEVTPDEFAARLNAALPDGLKVFSAEARPLTGKSLMARVQAAEYEARAAMDESELRARADAFLAAPRHVVTRTTKNGPKEVDIRPLVEALSVSGGAVTMRLVDVSGRKGRPEEVLAALGLAGAPVRKTATCLADL